MSKDTKETKPAGAATPAPAPAPAAPEISTREKEIRRRYAAGGGALSRAQAEEAVNAQEAHDARLAAAKTAAAKAAP